MEVSNMKNMVVLKNLPSNIVEEAFVVLKANKKIKNLERVDGSKKSLSKDSSKKESDYMLKEAEMIVSNYISKIESNDKNSVFKKKTEWKKNKKLKKYENTYFDYDFSNNCRNNIKNNTFRMDYMYYFIWNCYVCRTSKFGYRNCSRYDNSI